MSDDLEYINLSIFDSDQQHWENLDKWEKITQEVANSNAGKATCCKVGSVDYPLGKQMHANLQILVQ